MIKKLIILLSLFPLCLLSQSMVFSGVEGNIVHKLSSIIIKQAYANIAIEAKILFLPAERALHHSNGGLVDGELSRIKRLYKQYPNLLLVPVAMNSVQAAVYTHNNTISIKSWNDLKPYKLAIVKGIKFIEKGTKGQNPFVVSQFSIAFDMLLANRVDIVVIPKLTGDTLMTKSRYKKIKRLDIVLKKLALYHFLHKKNRKILPKITQSLQKMSASGELTLIRNKFISEH